MCETVSHWLHVLCLAVWLIICPHRTPSITATNTYRSVWMFWHEHARGRDPAVCVATWCLNERRSEREIGIICSVRYQQFFYEDSNFVVNHGFYHCFAFLLSEFVTLRVKRTHRVIPSLCLSFLWEGSVLRPQGCPKVANYWLFICYILSTPWCDNLLCLTF
jgi:hypothetical protein